ncbi:hypothetical protein D3C85_1240340 [compost metagenome]
MARGGVVFFDCLSRRPGYGGHGVHRTGPVPGLGDRPCQLGSGHECCISRHGIRGAGLGAAGRPLRAQGGAGRCRAVVRRVQPGFGLCQ